MLLKQMNEEDLLKLGKLMASPLGVECMGILDRYFYNTVSFTPGNTEITAFKEGHRDLIQVLKTATKQFEQQKLRGEDYAVER